MRNDGVWVNSDEKGEGGRYFQFTCHSSLMKIFVQRLVFRMNVIKQFRNNNTSVHLDKKRKLFGIWNNSPYNIFV